MKKSFIGFLFLTVMGCTSVEFYDVSLAKSDLENGRIEPGLKALEALSQKGYVEADTVLLNFYVGHSDPAVFKRAKALFDRTGFINERNKALYFRWSEKMATVDAEYLNLAHKGLKELAVLDESATFRLYRFESLYGERLNGTLESQNLDQFIEKYKVQGGALIQIVSMLDDPANYFSLIQESCEQNKPEMIYHCHLIRLKQAKLHGQNDLDEYSAQIANDFLAGRVKTDQIHGLIRVLLSNKIGDANVLAAYKLYRLSKLQQPELFMAIAKHDVYERKNFELEALEAHLEKNLAEGYQEAGLLLGILYYNGRRTPEEPWRAEKYFIKASQYAEAKYYLGQLYISNKLGEQDIQKGVDFLLAAARQGYYKAYRELIYVFNDTPGVKPNPVYVRVFVELAANFGMLTDENKSSQMSALPLSESQIGEAETLVSEELQLHDEHRQKLALEVNTVN